jgi:hypothetical protein
MADDAAKSRCRSLRQVFGCLFLVLWLPQANLDQFMARESLVEGFEHCRTDTPFPDEDDRPEGMGQTPKVFALFSVKGRRGAGYHRRREGRFGRRGRGRVRGWAVGRGGCTVRRGGWTIRRGGCTVRRRGWTIRRRGLAGHEDLQIGGGGGTRAARTVAHSEAVDGGWGVSSGVSRDSG